MDDTLGGNIAQRIQNRRRAPSYAEAEHSFSTENTKCANCGARAVAVTLIGGIEKYHITKESAFDAVSTATEDDEAVLKLLSDIETAQTIEVSGCFTLDLGGKTIELKTLQTFVIRILNDSSMRLIDTVGDGKIVGHYGISVTAGSTFIMESGSIISSSYYGVDGTSVTIVIDGTAYIETQMYGISVDRDSVVHIKGGTVNAEWSLLYSNIKEIIISGGTFTGKIYDNLYGGSAIQPVIMGGSFPNGIILGTHCPPLSALLADGYAYYVSGELADIGDNEKTLLGEVTVEKLESEPAEEI